MQTARLNLWLFGYIAYLYFIPLFFLLYRLHRRPEFDTGRAVKFFGALLGFLSTLLIQALIVDNELRGAFGAAIVETLEPIIGVGGIVIVALALAGMSVAMIVEQEQWHALRRWLQAKQEERREAKARAREQSKQLDETPPPIDDDEPITAAGLTPESAQALDKLTSPSMVQLEEAWRKTDEIGVLKNSLAELEAISQEARKHKEQTPSPSISKSSKKTSKHESSTPSAQQEPTPPYELKVEIVTELSENKELLAQIEQGRSEKPSDFKLPPLEFLSKPPKVRKNEINEAEIDAKIGELLEKLGRFKIEGDVVRTYTGPVVTTFEFKPAPHVKVSRILALADDIAMALKAPTVRIQAPIPGKDVVGIEIPNTTTETIYLREILESDLFKNSASPLTMALGKDIVGNPFVTDLKKLPHLLIAGTTGSGKSVGVNAMILSLLYRNSPDQLKLLMIDPKMLEFSIYNDIPHLLVPVITKPKQAIIALANMVREMERRYTLMTQTRTKNIDNYNEKAKKEGFAPLPFIVVIIDELADLMMTSGKDVEISIARLAQMARAAGIHLIVATQRPSVDVVTGLIKANLPSRISFRVGQKIDSKVILDQMGAESLLGRGDMLFTPPGSVGLVRLHAPWSTEAEIEKIVEFIKAQRPAAYDTSFLDDGSSAEGFSTGGALEGELDELYEEAKQIVLTERKTSISYIQRRLQIGYNRAARIVEQLEATGVLSEANAKGIREVID